MSTFVPKFKLYDSGGVNLIYLFPLVQQTNAPQSVRNTVIIEGIRGKGGIIIDGGDALWDLEIKGYLTGDDYEEIIQKIDALETAVELNTKYILKIDKTVSTYYQYKVKRIVPINYPESLRRTSQSYEIVFKSNAW